MRALHDAIALALQATRPKLGDRAGGLQWTYDMKAVLRGLRQSDRAFGAKEAERFVLLSGYTPELAAHWGAE